MTRPFSPPWLKHWKPWTHSRNSVKVQRTWKLWLRTTFCNHCLAPWDFPTTSAYKYTRCWRQAQYLSNTFWWIWVDEFLPALQKKQKWFRPYRNLAVGDLVLIADQHCPRGQWQMATVEEVMADCNGHLHQATVRTARCTLTRDIRTLCLIEAASAWNYHFGKWKRGPDWWSTLTGADDQRVKPSISPMSFKLRN